MIKPYEGDPLIWKAHSLCLCSWMHLKWVQLKPSEYGTGVGTGIKEVSLFQCNFTPFVGLSLPTSTSWKPLVMVAGQMCALVPSPWRCSQTTDNGEGFLISEWKKQASCSFLFKLIYLLPTYSQLPDCQCIPCLGFLCVLQKLQVQWQT